MKWNIMKNTFYEESSVWALCLKFGFFEVDENTEHLESS